MDITFKTGEGIFNYRVCAIIINKGKVLVMKDVGKGKYYYLPGGRVVINEEAEIALLRELKEELNINAEIIRPLWLNQNFFVEDFSKKQYHEICLYFLVDVSKTDLLSKGEKFTLQENKNTHIFEWLSFEKLSKEYIYPKFIKEKIFEIPQNLTMITEYD